MPYPDYLDMVKYYSDPEEYTNPSLTPEQLEDKKQSISDALTRLRKDD